MMSSKDREEVDVLVDDESGSCSSSTPDEFNVWLLAARSGDSLAMGKLLEGDRPYLTAIAQDALPSTLRSKCDESDIVQETLLKAYENFSQFEGVDSVDFRAWLRSIMKHHIIDCIRRYRTAYKRSIVREQSLHADPETHDDPVDPVDPLPTPQNRLLLLEQTAAVRDAVGRLTDLEQSVIHLRNHDCLPFVQIGHQLSRSSEAARKLWSRALIRLREML
jgi:RNA polymerase sigma-70 factor, ECF subfamily